MTTILITGTNRGLGLEHTRQALAAGDTVIATCRNPAGAEALRDLKKQFPDRLSIEALDLADFASIDALQARLTDVPVDLLLNSAAIYGGGWGSEADRNRQSIAGMDYELWQEIMRTNVLGTFRLTAAMLANLEAGERRIIVMMSSDLGSIANNEQGMSYAYRSSKAALNMLTKGLSVELAPRGFTVIALAPGWVRTDLGGPDAMWPVDESVRRQREVLAGLGTEKNGQFINLLGEAVPW